MTIDLSPWHDAPFLVDAIWAARRAARKDLLDDVVRLFDHDDPNVREEAISLAFVVWEERSLRDRLEQAVCQDVDAGVRARAAGALAQLADDKTRKSDVATLRAVVLNSHEDAVVRKAAYEGLVRMHTGTFMMLDDETDIDEDVDLDWVRAL